LARRLGTTDAELDALRRGDLSPFQPAWRAALRFAEQVTPTRGAADAELFAELAAHWTEPQIVEITAVIALFNYFNRFALALEIPVTR
jgi:alkylhydroperoxidase family enzyme